MTRTTKGRLSKKSSLREKTTKSLRMEAKMHKNMQKQGNKHCYNSFQWMHYKEFSKKK